jgi:N-acetylglucosaminyldiphosphoundecaprenol N-acetyl-beta-D-mannosaminyltransferase
MAFTIHMNAASLPCPNEATRSGAGARHRARDADRLAWPIALLGIAFENVTTAQAVERIAELVARRRPHRVITANADLVLRAMRDPAQRQSLLDADLVLGDSPLLRWASALLGNALRARVCSRDLVARLVRLAVVRHWKIGIVDARPEAGARIARRLRTQHAGLDAVGFEVPPGGGSPELLRFTHAIRAARSDILFVCVEPGAQGKWLAPLCRDLEVPVCLELGVPAARAFPGTGPAGSRLRAAGDFLQQAPGILRARARTALAFTRPLLRQWRRMARTLRAPTGGRAALSATENWVDIDAGGNLTRRACDAQCMLWRVEALPPAHCAIDASRVQRIDATGLALLARWRAALMRHGRQLVLVAPSQPVRTALIQAKLTRFFTVAGTTRQARELVGPPVFGVRTGQTRSLAWCGEIIAANADDVWQMTSQYTQTFAASGATLVIIDLTRLRFVDSAGAALMLRVKQSARDLGTEIVFVHSPAPVLNVLRAAGIDRLLLEGGQ